MYLQIILKIQFIYVNIKKKTKNQESGTLLHFGKRCYVPACIHMLSWTISVMHISLNSAGNWLHYN